MFARTKEEGLERVKKLVANFERNIDAFKSQQFNEERTKQEFINPFFQSLGWDVNNEEGIAPQYCDVIFEDSIKVGGGTKAPDYCFRYGGKRMFFVEAKKPFVDIKESVDPAYQLRRYAWSEKLPISILTDFEELAIYESNTKPHPKHKASIGRIKIYHYKEYVENWDEIWDIFSKDAVKYGLFDKYITNNSLIQKKGTSRVDDEFLHEIENWRLILAKNIAIRNKELTIEELNWAVQLTIDRIIFLRMAEDRGIEKYGCLQKLLKNDNIYEAFLELCKKADAKYNSGLFHFTKEKEISLDADNLTLNLTIDDGVFKTIFKNLYYPESPYEFSVISPEILGNIYEQFLGKVIRLTPSHMAKVEEKPEVKKAGGVFYTPKYIVDYIVENTVGELLKNKTPNQASELKIVDPACGSGSFLLGAYNYLLIWHRDYYSKLKKPPKDVIYQGKNDEYYLTITEKKRILLNNIYGVDIDSQAVEVTKLSLLLKVLENENKDVIEQQQKLFQERALPFLGDNIRCGNSLIGTDILEEELNSEEIAIVNPFDWEDEFKHVFENGGFDAVIGNPPYIKIQLLKQNKNAVKYYKKNYKSAIGNYDIYNLFVEKALNLTEKGHIGFIIPNKFILAKYGEGLRELITKTSSLRKLINFKDNQIFKNASTYTCLLFLTKNSNEFKYAEIEDFSTHTPIFKIIDKSTEFDDGNLSVGVLNHQVYDNIDWNFYIGKSADLINKLMNIPLKLGDITEKIFVGLQTSADKSYILKLVEDKGDLLELYSPETKKSHLFEKNIVKKYIKGKEIKRYFFDYQNKYIIFPYKLNDDNFELIDEKTMKSEFPNCWKYLKEIEKLLRSRENNKMNQKDKWWAFTYPRSLLDYRYNKIMTPNSAFNSSFSYDSEGVYYITVGVAGGYAIKLKENIEFNELYLLSILNSSLMDFFNKKIGTSLRGKYYSFSGTIIKNYPLINIEIQKQEQFIDLSNKMIQLNKNLRDVKTPNEKKLIENQIKATDKKINELVYNLYDLTKEEIAIIEIANQKPNK